MSTGTPSDAAMAAASDIGGIITKSASPLDEYGDLKFKTVSAIVDAIDRHFTPLREELAHERLKFENVEKVMLEFRDRMLRAEAETVTLRASNDKLRAALEGVEAWMLKEKDLHQRLDVAGMSDGRNPYISDLCVHIGTINRALAPERKETT